MTQTLFLFLIGLGCLLLNKRFAIVCSKTQESVWGLKYDASLYRLPIIFCGLVFLLIALGRFLGRCIW